MKIAAVVGARPNFVKIAPILAEMRHDPEFDVRLIHTGQHYDSAMSGRFFTELQIPEPDINLGIGSRVNAAQVAEIMTRLVPVLTQSGPDLVLVVGDVNSTLAAAVAAATLGIPIAHVEAGLRSFDRSMPEEINRVLVDAVSDYCFTTEPQACENLAREGIAPHRIHHVGNVMIDTLFRFRAKAAESEILAALDVAPRAYVVLTLHRPRAVDDDRTLTHVLQALDAVARDTVVVFPVHPRTRARLDALGAGRDRHPSMRRVAPLAYLDFLQLLANAACVLTDSGGIQEETTALGVPCLTLRDNTERPITVTQGTNRLVGFDEQKIASAWSEIKRGLWPSGRLPELWDGKAAERIVKVLRGSTSAPAATS